MTADPPRPSNTRQRSTSRLGGFFAGEESPAHTLLGSLARDARLWATILAVALGAGVIAGATFWQGEQTASRERAANAWYVHTLEVLVEMGRFSTALNDIQHGAREYVLTGDPRFLARYRKVAPGIPERLRRLRELADDNADQQARLAALGADAATLLALSRQEIELQAAGRHEAAVALAGGAAPTAAMERWQAVSSALVAEERRLLVLRRTDLLRATAQAARMTLLLAALGAMLLVAATALGALALVAATRARVASVRAQANERLAATGALLSRFVEEAPAAIAMFDRDMRYLAASRRYAVDYGLAADLELTGRSHYEVFPEISQRWREIHARVLAGEEMSCDEDPFPRADGHVDWVHWRMEPWRNGRGEIGGVLLFSEVITAQVEALRARRAAEARLHAIVESAAEAIVVIDEAGIIQSANPATTAMFGYGAGELVGRNVDLLMGGPDGFVAADLQAGRPQVIGSGREVEARRKDGSRVAVELVVAEWRDEGRRFFTGLMRDISARKLAEAQRQQAERRELIVGELRHRMNNMFSVINTLITATARAHPDVRSYRDALLARMRAFSASQLALAGQGWSSRGLRELVDFELRPYLEAGARVSIDGAELRLDGTAAEALAMVVHELATNAAKHGALSRPGGAVRVAWRTSGDTTGEGRLVLEWTERGGPAVAPPQRRGFGSTVIESSARALGGSARLDPDPEGLRCTIDVPTFRVVAPDPAGQGARPPGAPLAPASAPR